MFEKLFSEFDFPGSEYRGKPFWAWNGELDPKELRRQVGVFHKMGLGGFFMHSRVGLATEYLSDKWFECIDACVDEAEKFGMEAWLYDEDRWPSGSAGGLITKNPKYRMRYLVMEQFTRLRDIQWDSDVVAIYTARVVGSNAYDVKRIAKGKPPALTKGDSVLVFRVKTAPLTPYFNGYTYLDTLSHEAVHEFIKVTHEAYRKKFGKYFGKTIPGIFTDEPQHGAKFAEFQFTNNGKGLPWTPKLHTMFQARYGYDILNHLPQLFLNVDGEPITPGRHDYHDFVTFLFTDAFAHQIGQWCEENNLLFTGHVLLEETLSTQGCVVGSCMRFYEHMQAPGIDNLTEYKREYDAVKQVSSVARQFGRKWRLTELYGCTGWDFPFVGHKAIGDWQVALGINLRCPHLSLYTMEGEAKRDYPASISYQSPWWDTYNKVEDYFARINVVMTQGQEIRDLLVIHPNESAWMLFHEDCQPFANKQISEFDQTLSDLSDSLLAANIDFDYGDEDILSRHAKVGMRNGEPSLIVGKAQYKVIVVPYLLTIRGSTLDLLKKFKALGGTVIYAGKPAEYVDAVKSIANKEFAANCIKTSAKGKTLIEAVAPTCRRISVTDSVGKQIVPTLHLLREDKNAFYLFVCNVGHDYRKVACDHDEERVNYNQSLNDRAICNRTAGFGEVHISGFSGCCGKPIELDPEKGEVFPANARRSGDGWEILTSLPALGSRLFIIPKKTTSKSLTKRRKLRDVKVRKLDFAEWDIVLSDCNNLVLDRPCFKIGSGRSQPADEILRVDRIVRSALGISHRSGCEIQPWASKKSVSPPQMHVELLYSFDVNTVPSGDLFLGIERPERYCVFVNGTQVGTDMDRGWWVDKSLRKISIDPALLTVGKNEIKLICEYDENHPGLEIVYLLGNFGTVVRNTNTVITKAPTSLKLGDWVKQGLGFYSGSVGYRKTISVKLRKAQRLFLRVPDYIGTAVRILVNGSQAGIIGWEPNEVDITDFVECDKVEISIEVMGHRRNSHGPLHQKAKKRPLGIGPFSFVTSGNKWSDSYNLTPCGLMKSPMLIIRE